MKKHRIIAVFLTMVLVFSLSASSVFAVTRDAEGYIEVYSPFQNMDYYSGEQIYMEYAVSDTWTDYRTVPLFGVFSTDDNELLDLVYSEVVDVGMMDTYEYYYDLSGFKPGKYYIHFVSAAGYDDGTVLKYWSDLNPPNVDVYFNVKELPKPTNLKVATGKKKVVISYYKANGADKYQIYRSTKKNGGYKKIATTTQAKYVDKTAKKGKQYYYKVRSVRELHGTVYSTFTSPKRSKKVK